MSKDKVICQFTKREIDKEEATFIPKEDELNPFKKDIYVSNKYIKQLRKPRT